MTNPNPIIIHNLFGIHSLNIYWSGLFTVLGIVAAIFLIRAELKRLLPRPGVFSEVCIAGVPPAIILGRGGHLLFNPGEYGSLLEVLSPSNGGISYYGALIGAVGGFLIYSRIKRVSLPAIFDAAAPGVIFAQAIIRWGDFFNQTSYGPIVINRNHMWFPLAVKIDFTGEIHYATFFYESIWCLVCFGIIWFIIRRYAVHSGDTALAYLMLYNLGYGLAEYVNMDTPIVSNIRIYPILSAALFFAAAMFVIMRAIYERSFGRSEPGGKLSQPEQ